MPFPVLAFASASAKILSYGSVHSPGRVSEMLKKLFYRGPNHKSSRTDRPLLHADPFVPHRNDYSSAAEQKQKALPVDPTIIPDPHSNARPDQWAVPLIDSTPEPPRAQSRTAKLQATNDPPATLSTLRLSSFVSKSAPHDRTALLAYRPGAWSGHSSDEGAFDANLPASVASDASSKPTISASGAPLAYFKCQICHREMEMARCELNLGGTDGAPVGVCRSCTQPRQLTRKPLASRRNDGLQISSADSEPSSQQQTVSSYRLTARSRKGLFTPRHIGTATAATNGTAAAQADLTPSRGWIRTPSPVSQVHTCLICTEEYPHDDFLLPTSSCAHEADYCRQCMLQQIKSDLNSKGWNKIRCPDTSCPQMLSDADVLRHAPGKVYDRYSDLSIKTVLGALPDFHRCLSPRCGSGQIHTEADGPLFICHECGHKTCIKHAIPWHEGDTCQEYDYRTNGGLRRKEERASEATKRKTTRPCPKCKAPIEKISGCDHMKCANCIYEFCWLCNADYARI